VGDECTFGRIFLTGWEGCVVDVVLSSVYLDIQQRTLLALWRERNELKVDPPSSHLTVE